MEKSSNKSQVTVHFEMQDPKMADCEKIAKFESEAEYMETLPLLEQMLEKSDFDLITEVVE